MVQNPQLIQAGVGKIWKTSGISLGISGNMTSIVQGIAKKMYRKRKCAAKASIYLILEIILSFIQQRLSFQKVKHQVFGKQQQSISQ